jgi:phospholipid/cholesterol/gamma-HCH transport system permease protein
MDEKNPMAASEGSPGYSWAEPPWLPFSERIGHALFNFLATVRGLVAFALITVAVALTKFGVAREVTYASLYRAQARSGKQILSMLLFISVALGLVVVGETISRLTQFGTTILLGPIMVDVVMRELGPLLTAMLVMARAGTSNVIELGTARALGELDALEALRIDPIHYLVMPRVIGMAMAVFALTVYFIIATLASGYLFAFLNNVPLSPRDYLDQLTNALQGIDVVILILKTSLFGGIIAIITCYHGLAKPLRLEQIPQATVRAVGQSIFACVLLDAIFIAFLYL